MKLSEAYVEVKTNQKQFGKELKTMESAVKRSTDRMKKNFARIGKGVSEISRVARYGFLGMTAAIAGSVYAMARMGDEIHKMSIRTGVAAKELSALGYAARISGSNLDTVERSLRYLAARLYDADQGLAEAKRAFEELGIGIYNADGSLRSTVDVLKEFADKVTTMTDDTKKAALAGELFGMRYGPMLLPLLEEGSEGITKLMEKAEELGITIDTSSAAAAAEFTDRMEDMKGALLGLTREIGEIFLPVFRNAVVVIIDKVKEWRKAIDSLTPQQKKLIAQIVLLGTAALGAIGALGLFGSVARVIASAGSIIAGVLGLMTSPLGLIMVAVGALALVWAYNWGDIQGKTKAVAEFISKALGGIKEDTEGLTKKIETETGKQKNAWETFLSVLKIIGLGFREVFIGLGEVVKETLKAMGFDWDKFIEDWKAGMEIIKEKTKEKIKWVIEIVVEGYEWIKDTVAPWIADKAYQGWKWFVDIILEDWTWLKKTAAPWITEKAKKGWEWTIKLILKLFEEIKEAAKWIKDKATEGWEWIISIKIPGWEDIKKKIKDIGETLKGFFKTTKTELDVMGETLLASAKHWGAYGQVMKQKVAAMAATFILFKHKIVDVAEEAPKEFSKTFFKNFMATKPKIQKAILEALASGSFKRALSLAGMEDAKAFLGMSPGLVTGLEEGRKDLDKTLGKMLGSMEGLAGKMATIFRPIIGIFRKIFDAILKIIEKFNPEAAAEIKAFVDDAIRMMEGLFTAVEGPLDEADLRFGKSMTTWKELIKEAAEDIEETAEKLAEALATIWENFTDAVKQSFSDMFYDFMMGTSNFKDIWQNFCDSIKRAFVRSIAEMIVEKMGFDKLFEGNILSWKGLFGGLGKFIGGIFKGIGNVLAGILPALAKLTVIGAAIYGAWKIATGIIDSANREVQIFTGTLKDAKLHLKIMEKIGAAAHTKMTKFLKDIIYYGEKYGETLEAVVRMCEAEYGAVSGKLKDFLRGLVEAYDETGDAATDLSDTMKDATRDMGRSWRDFTSRTREEARKTWGRGGEIANRLREAIDEMKRKIDELPIRTDFDVYGNLHMPDIPRIGTQFFDIIGRYHAPSIPTAQIGIPYIPRTMPVIVHPKEAILTAPQAREWRAGGGGRGDIIIQRGAIRVLHTGDINTEMDEEKFAEKIAHKIKQEITVRT